MPTIDAPALESFAADLLAAGGATPEEARIVAQSLVASNLRGYESHGVMRIPFYLEMVKKGETVSAAPFEVLYESPTHIAADANWGFGQVQATRLLTTLLEKVQQQPVVVGTLHCCSHIGRLGEYCEQAAGQGLVSMMMVNSHGAAPRVAPPGGSAPRLSTNPLAIGAPHQNQPLILDFSTSATAEGKVRVKKIAGQPCPPGWLLDNQGRPTTDPNVLYNDPPGSILPMGGEQAYKGFGLSLMIEILTGALSGGYAAKKKVYPQKGNCVFLLLVDPGKFSPTEHFAGEVSSLVDYLRNCPRAEGVERITLPGDPERDVLDKRRENGIPFDEGNWRQLTELAKSLNVEVKFKV